MIIARFWGYLLIYFGISFFEKPVVFKAFKWTSGCILRYKTGNESYYLNPYSVLGRIIISEENFEETDIGFISKKIRDKRYSTIIDVGANIGYNAIKWAKAGAKIHCFEPSDVVKQLRLNVKENGFSDQIEINKIAISDTIGKVSFFTATDDAYSSIISSDRFSVKYKSEVESMTLDHFVNTYKLKEIDFIKVDVEGAELGVVLGAKKTLKDLRPDLLIEIFEKSSGKENAQRVIEELVDIGYSVSLISDKNSITTVREYDFSESKNYFFTMG